MKINITLGRTVSGPNTLAVPNRFTSGKHCRIYSDDETNIVYIEDLNSQNGTYVNGQEVFRYMLSVDDEIVLGGEKGYKTTLGNVLKMYEEQNKRQTVSVEGKKPEPKPEDETIQCLEMLRKIESDFQKAELDANDKLSSLTMLRMLPTIGVGAVSGIVTFFMPNPELQKIVGAIAGVLTIVVLIVAMNWTSKKTRKIKEAQLKMKEELHYKYVCPGCRHSLVGRAWVVLNQDRMCPYCRKKLS